MSTPELLMLTGVFHFALLFAHGGYIALTFGVVWGTGRRNKPVVTSDLSRRFDRTITNNLESMAAFIPVTTGSLFLAAPMDWATLAATIYLSARVSFAALYLLNIPYLRTVAWITGQLMIAVISLPLIYAVWPNY